MERIISLRGRVSVGAVGATATTLFLGKSLNAPKIFKICTHKHNFRKLLLDFILHPQFWITNPAPVNIMNYNIPSELSQNK